jgi:hypothetical protein
VNVSTVNRRMVRLAGKLQRGRQTMLSTKEKYVTCRDRGTLVLTFVGNYIESVGLILIIKAFLYLSEHL